MRDAHDGVMVAALAAAVVVVGGVLYVPAAAASLVGSGSLPSVVAGVEGSVRIAVDGLWSDPAGAYDSSVAAGMLHGAGWWLAQLVAGLVVLVPAGLLGVWLDRSRGRRRLGERRYDPRGWVKRRDFARPRDVSHLRHHVFERDRWWLGKLDRRSIASGTEVHPALVAPTRSGKTKRYVISWLLEHEGPAVVTSTKRDVIDATRDARAEHGQVWEFNPFSRKSCGWSPLAGCKDWSTALQQARFIADAVPDQHSEVARYWSREGAKLLAPLLHAAALDSRPMGEVVSWLDSQAARGPLEILKEAATPPAVLQLEGVLGLDSRNRGTTFMSATSLLEGYRHPAVQATERPDFDAVRLLAGANTLYLVASEDEQELLAPLFVGLLLSVFRAAATLYHAHGPLDPVLRIILDETANIAPMRSLGRRLAGSAEHGVRVATVWQDLAQMEERFGRPGADNVLGNSVTKCFLGPITDRATRDYVVGLLDHSASVGRDEGDYDLERNKASAQRLQQLAAGRALVVNERDLPAVVRVPFWWERGDLRQTLSEAGRRAADAQARGPGGKSRRSNRRDPKVNPIR